MLKKALSFVVSLIFIVGLTGCTTSENNDSNIQGSSTKKEDEKSANNENNMNLELINDDYITMTITKRYEKGDSAYKEIGYKVTIVNKTEDRDLLIGFNNPSVDGVMNDPAWATEIPAGKTSNETIMWWVGEGSDEFNSNVESLNDLKNVEGTITVSDNDTFDTLGEYDINIK